MEMGSVDEYINSFEGEKKEWMLELVDYMRTRYPEIDEDIVFNIPTYIFNKMYIAFSIVKNCFHFRSRDSEMIEKLKKECEKTESEECCARFEAQFELNDKDAIPAIHETIDKIVERNQHDFFIMI